MVAGLMPSGVLGLILRLLAKGTARLLVAAIFLASLVFGATVHLDLPVARRAAASILEQVLSQELRGSFSIGEFSKLGKDGLSVRDIEVLDPSGRTVITLKELSTDVDAFKILERVLSGHDKLSIAIDRVRADDSEIYLLQTLDESPEGVQLTHASIQDAFEPVKEPKTSKKKSPSRPVRIWLPHVDLEKVYVRGAIAGSPTVEARIDHTRARILATNKGASIDIDEFQLRASGIGGVDTVAQGEVHIRAPGAVWGKIDGQLGAVPTSQEFRLEKGTVDVKSEFLELKGGALRPLFGAWPLDQSVSLRSHLTGRPPNFHVEATLDTGKAQSASSAEIEGDLSIEPSPEGEFKIRTHRLNLNELMSELPESELDSESTVRLKTGDQGPVVSVSSRVSAGHIDGQATPNAEVEADYSEEAWSVEAALDEPGLEAHVASSQKKGEPIEFSVTAKSPSFGKSERLRALAPGVSGSARAKVEGSLDGTKLQLKGDVSGGGIQAGDLQITHTGGTFRLAGDTERPEAMEASLDLGVSKLSQSGIEFTDVRVRAQGAALAPRIELSAKTKRGLTLKASAQASQQFQTLRDVEAHLSGQGKPVDASADLVETSPRLRVKGLTLKSIGEVRGDVEWGDGEGQFDLVAEGLSISRIGHTLGFPRTEFGGELNGKIDLKLGAQSKGRVDIEVQNGAIQGLRDVTFSAHTSIDGQQTEGSLRGDVESLGTVESHWKGNLGGHVLREESYHDATGHFDFKVKGFDLKTAAWLTGGAGKLDDLSGSVDIELGVDRPVGSQAPSLEVQVITHGVSANIPGDEGAEELRIRGVDADWVGSLQENGKQLGSVLRLSDKRGPLASLSGTMDVPVLDWWVKDVASERIKEDVLTAPINIVAVLPNRTIASWPDFFPRPFESGRLSARVAITGSVAVPELVFAVQGKDFTGGVSPFNASVNLNANGRYNSKLGLLRGNIDLERKENPIGTVALDIGLPFDHLRGDAPDDAAFWTGEIRLLLDSSPLELLTEVNERDVSGIAQGSIVLQKSTEQFELDSEVTLRKLTASGYRLGDALVEAGMHQGDLIVRSSFNDEYGSLRVAAELGLNPTPMLFEPAEESPIFVSVESNRYDAAVLRPFVSDIVDELSGSLQGKLRGEWSPPGEKYPKGHATFYGKMDLEDGVIKPTALGQRLEDASLSLEATPKGDLNIVTLRDIQARARSKEPNLKGDGEFTFRSLDLIGGYIRFDSDEVPVMSEGVLMATVTGETKAQFELGEKEMRVAVEIDELTAVLPESSETNLIEVEQNSSIEVLQEYAKKKEIEESASEEANALLVQVTLGDQVRLKNSVLNLRVRGKPEIRITDETALAGYVELIPGGRVEVLGRGFVIERGTVSFDTGDASNPHLDAVAVWRAPNDVLVRATLGGTANDLKLGWSSEPALPGGEAEIIALVLGAGSGGGAEGNAGIAGLVANEALGKAGASSGVQIYANSGNLGNSEGRMASLNDDSWNSYTAAVRISDELWFEGSVQTHTGNTVQTGVAGTGLSGTLDWRFHPQWSMRTEFGNLGTGLDMVWRYRY